MNTVILNISSIFNFQCKFGLFCKWELLDDAQQMLQMCSVLNISNQNECAFRWACYNGHLKIAKWLLSVKPTIVISANNEGAFRWACDAGHLNVVQWLQSLNSDKYYFTVENGRITNWEVRVSMPIHSAGKLL